MISTVQWMLEDMASLEKRRPHPSITLAREFEVGKSRIKAEGRISWLTDFIHKRIIKLLKWDGGFDEYYDKSDVNKAFRAINETRQNGHKWIKASDLYRWLYEEIEDSMCPSRAVLDELKTQYASLPLLRSDEEVLSLLPVIYRQISLKIESVDVMDFKFSVGSIIKRCIADAK